MMMCDNDDGDDDDGMIRTQDIDGNRKSRYSWQKTAVFAF
jgi:hypothetical protein